MRRPFTIGSIKLPTNHRCVRHDLGSQRRHRRRIGNNQQNAANLVVASNLDPRIVTTP
jgi:hypothetical protein